jgi:hypothetical protein
MKTYYLVKKLLTESDEMSNYLNSQNNEDNSKITYNNNAIYFSTKFMFRGGDEFAIDDEYWCKHTDMTTIYYNFDYELKIENSMLKGKRIVTYKVERLLGCNSGWQKKSKCENNCGETDVYFVKQ